MKPCKHPSDSRAKGCQICTLAHGSREEVDPILEAHGWEFSRLEGIRLGWLSQVIVEKREATKIPPCIYLGKRTGESKECQECKGKVEVFLFECKKFGKCSIKKDVGEACCNGRANSRGIMEPCPEYQTEEVVMREEKREALKKLKAQVKWAYGVTTIPQRRKDLLPKTLASLREGGFDQPRLFVDGEKDPQSWEREFKLETTARFPAILPFGNWVLALGELFIREPLAARYAIFQDDLLVYRNLRSYLEASPFPEKAYQNLYNVPQNEELSNGRKGWYESNQKGRGAVGLVFSRDGVITLLTHLHMIERPMSAQRGWRNIDGGIISAMRKSGYKELVHCPSLLQHQGLESSIGINHGSRWKNFPQKLSETWRGEDFNALELLEEGKVVK